MSDECDLDELTAFLEASDSESEEEVDDKDQNSDSMSTAHGKKIGENADTLHTVRRESGAVPEDREIDQAEIEAFLEASGDEEGYVATAADDVDSSGQKGCTIAARHSELSEGTPRGTIDTGLEEEFEDMDEVDLEGIDKLISQTGSASSQSADLEIENQSTENFEKHTDIENGEAKDDVVGHSDVESDTMASEAEIEPDGHDAIKAEMAAMAKRMQELQALLEKSTPKASKPSAKKHHRSSEKRTDNVKKTGHTAHSSGRLEKRYSDEKRGDKSTHPFCHKKGGNSAVRDVRKEKNLPDRSKFKKDTCIKQESKDCSSSPLFAGHANKQKKGTVSTETREHKIISKMEQDTFSRTKPGGHIKEESSKIFDKGDIDDNPFFASMKSDAPQSTNSKALFGESDDSDWEDLGGEEKTKLSKEGHELKKLLTSGQRKREAHTPKYDPALIRKPNIARWTDVNTVPQMSPPQQRTLMDNRPALNPETGTVSGKYRVRDEFMPKSNLRKEDERESVTDPFCGIRIINPRISMEEFKRKMEGRNLIKISRLLSKIGTSELQRDNWVTVGVVVHKTEPRQSATGNSYCIWKLSDLQNCDKTVTFFLFSNVFKEHWKNQLGVVIGLLNPSVMDKAEKNQSDVAITINHPQQLLLMGTSKDLDRCRGTTKSGQPCSSMINKQQGDYCTYHVQAAYRRSSSKRTELQASTGVTPKAFEQKRANKNGCFFYGGNTYTTQRSQAKSSKDKITLNKLQSFEAKKVPGKVTTMSLHELEPEDEMKIQKLEEKDKNLLSLLSVPSAGSLNFVKHLVKKDANATLGEKEGEDTQPIVSVSAKDLLKQHQKTLQQKQKERRQQMELMSAVPKIGKGLSSGQEISLDMPLQRAKLSASAELAKQLAIAKVKAKGGINKEDPNAVKKKITSPEAREKIKKRVAADMEADASQAAEDTKEPPKKKSKLLGEVDLNSSEVQKLLKQKSKHTGALAEAEAEHEERYFGELEKKERMEDKMASIMEVPVTLFHCTQCKYKNTSLHERCKAENHSVTKSKGTKRFFKCKQCKKRMICFDKFPTEACKECGTTNYERVSLLKERKGPTLESEELCLRGNEQKYLGSLQGKAFLNV